MKKMLMYVVPKMHFQDVFQGEMLFETKHISLCHSMYFVNQCSIPKSFSKLPQLQMRVPSMNGLNQRLIDGLTLCTETVSQVTSLTTYMYPAHPSFAGRRVSKGLVYTWVFN